jgi:hypothetical protein
MENLKVTLGSKLLTEHLDYTQDKGTIKLTENACEKSSVGEELKIEYYAGETFVDWPHNIDLTKGLGHLSGCSIYQTPANYIPQNNSKKYDKDKKKKLRKIIKQSRKQNRK